MNDKGLSPMKRTHWLALAAALLPAVTSAAPVGSVDVYRELLRFRTKPGHDHTALLGDSAFGTTRLLKHLLDKPHSLYSKPLADPPFAAEPWWQAFSQEVAPDAVDASGETLDALRFQLGLTRARPGHEVTLTEHELAAFHSREVAANALKAGIDADIFWKAFDMNGSKITVAAAEGVAVQMLRDLMYATPKSEWAANAIRRDVHDRYMAQTDPDRLPESDIAYLANIAAYALRKGGPTLGFTHGANQLPIAFRIARLGAAYKDSKGYFGQGYCTDDKPSPGLRIDATALDDHAPLCFIAATDRAVLAWFQGESALEAQGVRIHESHHEGWSRLAMWIGQVLMFMDLAAFAEVIEASVAGEVIDTAVADGTFDAAEGDATSLLCARGDA
jgi:hypothetical protein